jgi:hypothetical protein
VNTAVRNSVPKDEIGRYAADQTQTAWSNTEGLLATLIDEIRQLSWLYATANSGKTIPKPEPIKRPGIGARTERKLSLVNAQRLDPRLRGLSDEAAQERLDMLTGRHNG